MPKTGQLEQNDPPPVTISVVVSLSGLIVESSAAVYYATRFVFPAVFPAGGASEAASCDQQ